MLFERLYRRTGRRNPLAALATVLHLEHLVFAGFVPALLLFVPMSIAQLLVAIAATAVYQEVYALLTLRRLRSGLESVDAWIGGSRDHELSMVAWRDAASAPYQLLSLSWKGGYPFLISLAWALAAICYLGQPWWGAPVLYAVALLLIAYGNGLVFLLFERSMAPVLDDIGRHPSEDVPVDAEALPLRRRLLSVLPATTVGGPPS
ncbi:hypothetical protein [Nocardioides aquiterrae]|uniref:Sensor domain-containing protein n=1 Tax=Nocardioides aquiterrae TaxID=203799 RepID=A0ABN1U981_9ACTN